MRVKLTLGCRGQKYSVLNGINIFCESLLQETTDENTLHITETEKNTVTNELSPPASGNNRYFSIFLLSMLHTFQSSTFKYRIFHLCRPFAAEYLVPTPSIQLNSVKQSSYSSSAALRSTTSYQGTNDSSSVFPEAESSTKQQTSEMPNLNSSRRRGNRLSNDKMQQDVSLSKVNVFFYIRWFLLLLCSILIDRLFG